ncbi:hypothetical protein [uncultured Clostridium sp.]|uniref:hypothetical protein n=1 Tax=uncultured Clostridium sp. TaxID=59620 RepID=UPI0028EF7231|nr:hypothetical protein [uncultured Clostridium sp.]
MGLVYSDKIETCEVCKEPIGIVVDLYFGSRLYPRACKCRREIYRRERLEEKNREKQIGLKRVIDNALMDKSISCKCDIVTIR